MRIIVVHNIYQQQGGEDAVVEAEIALLRSRGHEVELYSRDNDDIAHMPMVKVAIQALWSSRTMDDLTRLIRTFQPDVIHVHNTLSLISPSVYWAAARANVPVVQTLHNFRMMCLNALFLHKGKLCEACVGHLPWFGVMRKCYRNSGAASMVLAGMLILHRMLGTYTQKIDHFIVLTQFAKTKYIESKFSSDKLTVKPNFYSGVGIANNQTEICPRQGALFVGRISQEKGISTLLRAWGQVDCDLLVAGDGPTVDTIHDTQFRRIRSLGNIPRAEVANAMTTAEFLVMPSECYEGFPMVLVEAFAHGLPVVASRLGSMVEIVDDGVTGLHFNPGDAEDLAAKVNWLHSHPDECRQMGKNARREFEKKYTPERNHELLMKIYKEVIDEKKQAHQH